MQILRSKKSLASLFVGAALIMGAANGTVAAAELGALPFPAPGTYQLDRILHVPFSLVRVGNDIFPRLLASYTTGKITLLTFFYSQCTDPKGCPLAWSAFQAIRDKIMVDPQLKGKVRLVFYSFDPVHDSPQTLQFFANSYKNGANIIPWYFMTAWNSYFLKETLPKFGQEIAVVPNNLGQHNVVINHLLKVLLIDRDGWVREIYTSNFLTPDVLLDDIKTLALEESKQNLGD